MLQINSSCVSACGEQFSLLKIQFKIKTCEDYFKSPLEQGVNGLLVV